MNEFLTSPIWFIALPLLLAFLSPLWARFGLLLPILCGAEALLFVLSMGLFPTVLDAPLLVTIVIAPPLGIHLHVDAAALLLTTLFSFAGVIVGAFLWLYPIAHLRSRQSFILILLLIAGANGMVLTGDLFNLYVFLEIAGISAYSLSAIRQDALGLAAGFRYLVIGSVAAVFFLLGVVLIYLHTGSLNLAAIAMALGNVPVSLQIGIGLLFLVGLGIKAELFPFNFWVPAIYQGSDPVVAGLFSGVVVKAFLFVLFHLVFLLLAAPQAVQIWLMALGGATMLIAEWAALQQQDLRRMLAYSSLGQVGLMTLALAFGGPVVVAGALFHIVNHTLVKLLLFLLAALILIRTGSARLADLGGLARRMPLTVALFVLGALAVLGLPPTSGFISKLWILKGMAAAEVFWPVALILGAALLEAGYYFRWIKVFYRHGPGPADSPTADGARQADDRWDIGWAYAPVLVLAGLILVFGVAPALLEPYFVAGAQALLQRDLTLDSVLGGQP